MLSVVWQIDGPFNEFADFGLLNVWWLGGIDPREIIFLRDPSVFLMNLPLKNAKTLVGVVGVTHIHAGLVVLETSPAVENPSERDFQRHIEEKCNVWRPGVTVEFSNPVPITAAHNVPRKGRVNIAVGKYDVTRMQQGQNLTLVPIGEIGAMNHRESGWREKLALLTFSGCPFDDC